MCAIIGAQSVGEFEEILNVNRYRGEVSHSIAYLDMMLDGRVLISGMVKSSGSYNSSSINHPLLKKNSLIIGHTQAPTTQSTDIHPSIYRGAMLWHNGIVKQKEARGWDTLMILEKIYHHGFSALSDINGSFACLLLMDERLYVFRNEISPLFINNNHFCLSSTKIAGMEMLPPNNVYAIEPGGLRYVSSFRTKENPYFFINS